MITHCEYMNGISFQMVFDNGLNLSIIQHDVSYSCKESVEVAILDPAENFVTKDFIKDLNDDVKGHVKADELADLIFEVKNWSN